MDDGDKAIGVSPYQGPRADRVRDALALLRRKCELRAMLQELQEKIDLTLPHLDQRETQELLALMAVEASDVSDADAVRVQEEAIQAAEGIRPIDAKLTRPATKALRDEVIRRLSAGQYCAPTELLISEAVRAQFER